MQMPTFSMIRQTRLMPFWSCFAMPASIYVSQKLPRPESLSSLAALVHEKTGIVVCGKGGHIRLVRYCEGRTLKEGSLRLDRLISARSARGWNNRCGSWIRIRRFRINVSVARRWWGDDTFVSIELLA
jgi:hypothetical protein